MKRTIYWFGILIVILSLSRCTCNKAIAEDSFAEDASGWTIVGDAQGGYVEASYSPDGGVTGGHIYAKDDVAGGVWYFNAPSSYLGDRSEYYDKTLYFSLFQNSKRTSPFKEADVIFQSEDKQITYLFAEYPDTTWTNYSVKINADGGWLVGNHKSKDTATEEYIKAVLSNVTAFKIRGEFESGPDEGGLDDVRIAK